MQYVAIVVACLFAGALAQNQCPPPDEHANATFLADPEDCHSYYECDFGKPVHKSCPEGLVWNQTLESCDFSWSTPCTTTPPSSTENYIYAQDLPTCPPPDPTGQGNATYYPDDTDCHSYYECDNGVLQNRTCPDNLVWSQELLACDHEWSTPCNTERRHHVALALLMKSKAAGRNPSRNTEKYLKLHQKLLAMHRARRHQIHKL